MIIYNSNTNLLNYSEHIKKKNIFVKTSYNLNFKQNQNDNFILHDDERKTKTSIFAQAVNKIKNIIKFTGKKSNNFLGSSEANLVSHSDDVSSTPSECSLSASHAKSVNNEIDYSNTKEFSEYFEQKIKKDLKKFEKEDIKNIISEVSKETGADKKLVKEVIARLTQFSSYSQLDNLTKELKKIDINRIYYPGENALTVNDALIYIIKNKQQAELNKHGNKQALFLDDAMLECLKKMKNNIPEEFDYILKKVKDGKTILIQVDGWNASVNGENVSFGLFGYKKDLKTSATEIVKKIRNENISVEQALNGEFTDKSKKVLGEDIKIKILKNNKIKNNSTKEITKVLSPIYPDQKTIESVINTIVEFRIGHNSENEKKQARELLAKYFDNMLVCHSSQTITEILKKKYKEIGQIVEEKGKTMDDVIYVIPEKGKSFDLITYQYAVTNGIEPSKILKYNGKKDPPIDLNGKVIVILDDVVGSGNSLTGSSFDYQYFILNRNIKNQMIIFSPISSLKMGEELISEEIYDLCRTNYDVLNVGGIVDYEKFEQSLSREERNLLEKMLGYSGFVGGHACTVMPYMIPDNNTSASGFLLEYFINNVQGNKSPEWYHLLSHLVEAS